MHNSIVLKKTSSSDLLSTRNSTKKKIVVNEISKFLYFLFIFPRKVCYNENGDIMFNKIYVKIVNFIKEEYKFLIFLAILTAVLIYPLPYNIHMGGGTVDVAKKIEIQDEYKENGSYNMAYVKTMRATIPTYLLSYVFNWEREDIDNLKFDENDDPSDIWERERIYLQEANDNAVISAYTKANEDIDIKKELLKIIYVDKDSDTDLKIGDTPIKIGDIEIKEFADIAKILENYNVGDKISVTYLRDDKEKEGYFTVREFNDIKKIGLYLVRLFEYDLKRKIKIDFNSSEGGPSGGFMLSLAIYDRLTEEDLAKGRKIVGTGTIDNKGNVGMIGGVKYKVMGANSGDADILFVPVDNYEEAIKFKEEKGYDINIVKVSTLDDAIEYLRRN